MTADDGRSVKAEEEKEMGGGNGKRSEQEAVTRKHTRARLQSNNYDVVLQKTLRHSASFGEMVLSLFRERLDLHFTTTRLALARMMMTTLLLRLLLSGACLLREGET